MAEQETRNLTVSWITSRIERDVSAREMERVFFEASDNQKYYISLETQNRSAELVAVSLIRDAFVHQKRLNVWWEERNGRRWLKAVNLFG
jgi:hypothetical protein